MLSSSRQDRSRAERVSCDLSRSKVRDLILKISNRLFRGTCVKSEEISSETRRHIHVSNHRYVFVCTIAKQILPIRRFKDNNKKESSVSQ